MNAFALVSLSSCIIHYSPLLPLPHPQASPTQVLTVLARLLPNSLLICSCTHRFSTGRLPISLTGLHVLSPLPDRECLQDSATYESFLLPSSYWPTVGIYEWINGRICPSKHEGLSSCYGLSIYLNYTHVIHDYIPTVKHSNNIGKTKLPFAYLQSQFPSHLYSYAMKV